MSGWETVPLAKRADYAQAKRADNADGRRVDRVIGQAAATHGNQVAKSSCSMKKRKAMIPFARCSSREVQQ